MKVTSTPPQQPKVETQPQQAAIQAQQRAQTLAKPAAQSRSSPSRQPLPRIPPTWARTSTPRRSYFR